MLFRRVRIKVITSVYIRGLLSRLTHKQSFNRVMGYHTQRLTGRCSRVLTASPSGALRQTETADDI